MVDPRPATTIEGGRAEPGITKARIFVADDDAEMRNLLASVLRHDGHEVSEACDAETLVEAIGASTQAPPSLVISDVQMPGSSGLRALAWVRRRYPSLPFVLITAFGSPELHAQAARLGVTAMLDKPFSFSDLRELAKKLVGQA
jgi:DNA-binding NtrC family response regulator